VSGQDTVGELERVFGVSGCRREGLVGLSGDKADGLPSLLFSE